jgi:hypothetical protein
VLCCRADRHAQASSAAGSGPAADSPAPPDDAKTTVAISRILDACGPAPIHWVGRVPGKAIDNLLGGRVLVVGDDADLAAVVLRLMRKDRLGSVEVAFANPLRRSPFADLWDLPTGAPAVRLAAEGEVDLVPLVRDDVGGVVVGVGFLEPVNGTVYVDEKRVLRGAARQIRVQPDRDKGLAVTVTRKGFAGIGRRPVITRGRAVQIGTMPTSVTRDGIPYPRKMDRWTFYKHTEPLRLVRGLV